MIQPAICQCTAAAAAPLAMVNVSPQMGHKCCWCMPPYVCFRPREAHTHTQTTLDAPTPPAATHSADSTRSRRISPCKRSAGIGRDQEATEFALPQHSPNSRIEGCHLFLIGQSLPPHAPNIIQCTLARESLRFRPRCCSCSCGVEV